MLKDFAEHEISALKRVNPDIPVTTNFMQTFEIDYSKLSRSVDFISWDNYPAWHSNENECLTAAETALFHSLFNSFKKDKPFMMMESSPSATNWQSVSKLRRPGMHLLASMQAVAHGSDTVQYFQWRKSRGQSEQFHGAVVGHDNSSDTRVFKDVSSVGEELKKLEKIAGTTTANDVAMLIEYDSIQSLKIAQAYRNIDSDKGYFNILLKNFTALWHLNIGCDVVFADDDFSKYKVIIAPMLFMLKNGVKEKLEGFVKNGGIFVATFATGVVDEYGLSFFDKECYPLRKILGVKPEETDSLYDGQFNSVKMFGATYKAEKYCELAYPEGSTVIGTYQEDFYKGMSAITVNSYGNGKAYYIATDLMIDGYSKLYHELLKDIIPSEKFIESPENVSITMRYSEDSCYVFILNFNNESKITDLPFDYETICGEFKNETINPYGVVVLKKCPQDK